MKALGIDRASEPVEPTSRSPTSSSSPAPNIAECSPITTSYIWRARDRGAKLIVADPRVTPIARTADVFLGLRPGTDSALMGTILHVLIERDWLDHDFIRDHTDRLRRGRRGRAPTTRRPGAPRSPACPRPASRRPPSSGAPPPTGMLLHARGIEHQTQGRRERALVHQPRPGDRQVRQARLRRHARSPARATARAAASTARSATSSPATATSTNPEHRQYVASVWGCDRRRDPRQGPHRAGDHGGHPRGRDQGPAVDLLQPGRCRSPTPRFTAEALDRLEFYGVIDFFLSETAVHADVVCPARSTRRTRASSTTRRRPRGQDQRRPSRRPATPGATGRSSATSPAASGAGHVLPVHEHPRDLRRAARSPRRAAPPTTPASPGSGSRPRRGLLALPDRGPPGHAAPLRGRPVRAPRRTGAVPAVAFRPPAEVVDDDYPIWLTTGRVVSQYLSGTQTRRIGPLVAPVPRAAVRDAPSLAEQHRHRRPATSSP